MSELKKVSIEIDVFNGLDTNGIYSSVYIGESDDPIEVSTNWDEILENEIEMHCVPHGGPFVVSSVSDSVQEIMRQAQQLREVADKMDAAVNERGVLLRDELLREAEEKNLAYMDIDRNKYVVDYVGYLNYIMEKR